MERPKPPMDNTPIGNEPSSGMKMPSGGVMMWVIVAVIAVAAAFGVNYMFGVSKSGMDTQTKATDAKLAAMQSDLKASKDSITAAIAAINPAVTKQVSDGLSSINAKITTLQTSVDNANSSSQSATNQVTNLGKTVAEWQSQLATIKADVATLKSFTTNADLKTALNLITDRVTSLETKVTTLNTQVVNLITPTTTTTTTVTGTGVSANFTGNVFTGTIGMTFNPIAVGSSATQSLSVQVNNKTGKALNGLQLALALQSLDSNSIQTPYPANVVVGVSSNVSQFTWTSQSTGLNYLMGWVGNTASTGFLGQLNQFSQATGIYTYTINVTVTNNGATPTNVINLMPFIQVVNFTNP